MLTSDRSPVWQRAYQITHTGPVGDRPRPGLGRTATHAAVASTATTPRRIAATARPADFANAGSCAVVRI